MRVDSVEQMILNEESPVAGMRCFRLEYGGHATNCLFEGTIYLHNTDDVYDKMDRILEIIMEENN